ncbi:MAG: hypothetical protein ACLU9T_06775 [Blautia faecis]
MEPEDITITIHQKYRELSARIVEKLAQHYGKHPSDCGMAD